MDRLPEDQRPVDLRSRGMVPAIGHRALYVVPGEGGGEWRTRHVVAFGAGDDGAPRALVAEPGTGRAIDFDDPVARTWAVVTYDEAMDLARQESVVGVFVDVIDEAVRQSLTVDAARRTWAARAA